VAIGPQLWAPAPSQPTEILERAKMTQALQGTEQSIVDLTALKARCLGNVDLVERVLKKFAAQLDGDLKELERALSVGDASTFAAVAHRIKGSSANIEARHLSANASLAERQALTNQVTDLPQCLQQLKQDRHELSESLAAAAI
jgi:HPt (histidine-containing phosphotransfer) domain-containing protein